ncbi:hypothetical protein [Mucilaginibacter sp.]
MTLAHNKIIYVNLGLLLVILVFNINNCFSQDTVKRHDRLTQSVAEDYYVLKGNKTIKQGLYQAIYGRNTALASGVYNNNKQVGIWHFYDAKGQLVENFDFDKNAILYEESDNYITEAHIRYGFDDSVKKDDKVTKPMKTGGRCFGYIPYLSVFRLSDDYINADFSQLNAILEILVSPGGRLADFKIHIQGPDDSERITSFSPDLIDYQDRLFVPATINGKPVLSRIFVRCRITDGGQLDVY